MVNDTRSDYYYYRRRGSNRLMPNGSGGGGGASHKSGRGSRNSNAFSSDNSLKGGGPSERGHALFSAGDVGKSTRSVGATPMAGMGYHKNRAHSADRGKGIRGSRGSCLLM